MSAGLPLDDALFRALEHPGALPDVADLAALVPAGQLLAAGDLAQGAFAAVHVLNCGASAEAGLVDFGHAGGAPLPLVVVAPDRALVAARQRLAAGLLAEDLLGAADDRRVALGLPAVAGDYFADLDRAGLAEAQVAEELALVLAAVQRLLADLQAHVGVLVRDEVAADVAAVVLRAGFLRLAGLVA